MQRILSRVSIIVAILSLSLMVNIPKAQAAPSRTFVRSYDQCLKRIKSSQKKKEFIRRIKRVKGNRGITLNRSCKVATLTAKQKQKLTSRSRLAKSSKETVVALVATSAPNCTTNPGLDLNGDRKINVGDLIVLTQNYGRTGTANTLLLGDIDGDGRVAFADLLILAQQYGTIVCTEPFKVYDGVAGYVNEPQPFHPQVEPIALSSHGSFFRYVNGAYDYSSPHETTTRNFLRQVQGKVFVIDIECYPVDIRLNSADAVRASIEQYLKVIRWTREERPDLKIGIYSILPLSDFWTPNNYHEALAIIAAGPQHPRYGWAQLVLPGRQQRMDAWKAANDFLRPIADAVDIIFPSLYMHAEDPAGFDNFARGNIAEAKRYGNKPVFPFIWPRYHESSGQRAGDLMSAETMLSYYHSVKAHEANGMILWDAGHNRPWDSSFPWLLALINFLSDL